MPQDLMPEAKSVITFAVNFFSGAKRVEPKRGFGRVARYAWGKDYHIVVKERIQAWAEELPKIAGRPVKTKILVDSSPLLERAFAAESGLGFVGKNTLIISRKLGSFIFLSEMLIDLELEPDVLAESESVAACGSCKECIADCPTGALVAPRQLDARKCISYWTIENKGEIIEEMRPQIGDWIFGCDICQDVCPYNGLSKETKWKEFLPEAGTGPYLSLLEVLAIRSEEDFKKRFEGTPILRAKRTGLVRNACVVAGNQKCEEAVPSLIRVSQADPDPIVRSHALWALKRLR
jgi:epoxyqueuosine reductase